ncbi:hypothetical protein [Streptomyces sp. NPDC056190]|uniref:hypothetical protein n=1 Tax=Streptomyces sp. NPDC056190 TaxID=3345741 RepID=UPI0035D72949
MSGGLLLQDPAKYALPYPISGRDRQRPGEDEAVDDGSGIVPWASEPLENNPIQAPTTRRPTTTMPVADFCADFPLPVDRFTQ